MRAMAAKGGNVLARIRSERLGVRLVREPKLVRMWVDINIFTRQSVAGIDITAVLRIAEHVGFTGPKGKVRHDVVPVDRHARPRSGSRDGDALPRPGLRKGTDHCREHTR